MILGCVAQVRVAGKVVKVEATRDEYIGTYGDRLGGGTDDQQAKN